MKKNVSILSCFIFCMSIVLLTCPSSNADEYDGEEFMLEEITVTAQKREQNQQKVPVAMETVSGEDIREMGYNSLEQIMSAMSGVYINRSPDGVRVSIRGMSDDTTPTGTLMNISNSTPSVAVNVDGVFTSRRSSGQGLYDLERVEVLYGPQSTLYSSNSPGGIVNIETANPKIDAKEVSGTLKIGNYDLIQTEGVLNVPVGGSFAIRTAFTSVIRDGYMANGADDEDSRSARIKALFQPSEKFSILLTGQKDKGGGHGYSGTDNFIDQDDLSDPWDNSEYEGNDDAGLGRASNKEMLTARIAWALDFGTLTIMPSTSKTDTFATTTGTSQDQDYVQSIRFDSEEKGGEIRFTSSDEASIQWIVGANYYEAEQFQNLWQSFESLGFGLYKNRGNEQESKAIYGNITYPFNEKLRVTAGLRYSKDENESLQAAQNLQSDLTLKDIYSTGYADYDSPDYKIGVEYDIRPQSMLYADISTSYRVMAISSMTAEPEELISYTIGSKNRFFDNRFQLNVSAFFYDYTNYLADGGLLRDPVTLGPDDGATTSGDLEKYGIDLQTTTVISENDLLNFSVSYLHSEFTRLFFDFESEYLPDLDYKGNPETFSPDWTINLSYSHMFELSNGGSLNTKIETRYQSEFRISFMEWYQDFGSLEFLPMGDYAIQEGYTKTNFTVIYNHPNDNWSLTGYVDNIENYAVKKNLMMGSTMIGAPRTYGVVLSVMY